MFNDQNIGKERRKWTGRIQMGGYSRYVVPGGWEVNITREGERRGGKKRRGGTKRKVEKWKNRKEREGGKREREAWIPPRTAGDGGGMVHRGGEGGEKGGKRKRREQRERKGRGEIQGNNGEGWVGAGRGTQGEGNVQ